MTRPAGRPLWVAFVALVAIIVGADQLTKAWIAGALAGGRVVNVVGEMLRLIYGQNNGALFGLFRGQVGLFGLLSLAVIGLIVTYHARSGRNPYLTLTLGLLLGGAIGNAIDRFRLGYVIDFVDAGIGTTRFYTFNLADACISTAVVLLLAMAVWPSLAEGGRPPDGRTGDG
jgi:signal peptidase II